ncbi:MAG: microcystin-dependent protein [Maribacter sp.]|jgi:microcystin-dependent protein
MKDMYSKVVLGVIAVSLSILAIKNLDIINSANAVVDYQANHYGMNVGESEPMLGEIRLFAGDYVPEGWALCDGEMLEIDEYRELYKVIGDTYGGDTEDFFGLPDLRGRAAVGSGSDNRVGKSEFGTSKLLQSKEIVRINSSNIGLKPTAKSKTKLNSSTTTLSSKLPPSTRNIRTGNLALNYIICIDGWMSRTE